MAGKSRVPMQTQMAIVEAYKAGKRAGEIASMYSISRSCVIDIARRHGCTIRGQHHSGGRPRMETDHLHAEVCRLRDLGLSQPKIGAAVGVSQCIVSRVLRKLGRPTREGAKNHGNWKGGRVNTSGGYVAVMGGEFPEMKDSGGYTLEHRLVMARHLGRPLDRHETVHHINGDRKDNRIENLQLRKGKHGKGVAYQCECCGSMNVKPVRLS